MGSNWPVFTEEEIDAVASVLRSGKVNYWTGDKCQQFEANFAEYTGVKHAISLSNGTVALELALHALGIKAGDEVIVTPRTFVASANVIALSGAIPIFADVCPKSGNITAETVKPVITPNTKAIIAVHISGWPCEMTALKSLADEHGLFIIEDCAQAHGAQYKGKKVGSLGDIAAFSFCQDKIISTGGEGGMLTTNNTALWEKAWAYKEHGKSHQTVFNKKHSPGFRWLHESFGSNMRMTEMQAAIGLIQLGRLDDMLAARKGNADILSTQLADVDQVILPEVPEYISHAWYKYHLYLTDASKRQSILSDFEDNDILPLTGSCSEIYLEKSFSKYSHINTLECAHKLGESSLMFLVDHTIAKGEMLSTAQKVKHIIEQY